MRLRDVKPGKKVLFNGVERTVDRKDTYAPELTVKLEPFSHEAIWVSHKDISHAPAKKAPEVGSAEWAEEMGRQGKKVRLFTWERKWWMSFCDGAWRTMDGKLAAAPIVKRGWELFEEHAAEQSKPAPIANHKDKLFVAKPAPTFKVGDVVDCDGTQTTMATVRQGKVSWFGMCSTTGRLAANVEGKWSDGAEVHTSFPEQMRHHVAKEEVKAVQFPDKMEKREGFKYEQMPSNQVTRPSHYTWISGIECKDVAKHFSCMVGQAIQYQWRHLHKGKPVEDLEKAVECLKIEIARLKKGTK